MIYFIVYIYDEKIMHIDEKIRQLKKQIKIGTSDLTEFFNQEDESAIVIQLIKELTGEQVKINQLISEDMFEQIIYMIKQIDIYLKLMAKWFHPMEFAGDYHFLKEIWDEVQKNNPY